MRFPSCLLPAFAVAISLLACAGDGGGDATGAGEAAVTAAGRVETVASAPLPIEEVSGLGHRKLGSKRQYLAIADASSTLLTFDISAQGRVSAIEQRDLSGIFRREASQWEAVAGDGDGRVFFLEEARDRIHVVDKNLRKIIHEIKLVIPREHPLSADWAADENSRGEGMVLLNNGHVIVAKEKAPAALVEFVPRGEAPAGYSADLALGDAAFKLPSGEQSELVASKHWLLKNGDLATIGDISDLALDEENRLLLLSDQGRAIVSIERTLDVGEARIDLREIFALPREVSKPEGLAFADGRPFVAVDGKNADDDALFEVTRLPRP